MHVSMYMMACLSVVELRGMYQKEGYDILQQVAIGMLAQRLVAAPTYLNKVIEYMPALHRDFEQLCVLEY